MSSKQKVVSWPSHLINVGVTEYGKNEVRGLCITQLINTITGNCEIIWNRRDTGWNLNNEGIVKGVSYLMIVDFNEVVKVWKLITDFVEHDLKEQNGSSYKY